MYFIKIHGQQTLQFLVKRTLWNHQEANSASQGTINILMRERIFIQYQLLCIVHVLYVLWFICYVCVMYFILSMNVLFCKFAGYSHFQSRLVFLRCPCMIDFLFFEYDAVLCWGIKEGRSWTETQYIL